MNVWAKVEWEENFYAQCREAPHLGDQELFVTLPGPLDTDPALALEAIPTVTKGAQKALPGKEEALALPPPRNVGSRQGSVASGSARSTPRSIGSASKLTASASARGTPRSSRRSTPREQAP